jgi:two-component system, NarL family, nitrate/nitrite response regulator NarL
VNAAAAPRFLLVDDHAVVREGMAQVLRRRWQDAVVDEAASLDEAEARIAADAPPDLALLDLHLPEPERPTIVTSGGVSAAGLLDNLRRLRSAQPLVPVLVVSGLVDAELARACLQLGASGYLPKSAATMVMLRAIELVLDGGLYLPPFLASVATAPPPRSVLTPRQRDVLRCLVQGMANKEIARALTLAEPTVKAHLVSIFRILDVRNRAQAVLAGRDLLARDPG